MKKSKRILKCVMTVILAVAVMAGAGPIMNSTAYASSYYETYLVTSADNYQTLPDKVVHFNNYDWYIIADDSTAVDAGTVTLFAKDIMGTSRFNPRYHGNAYNGSSIEAYLDNLVSTSFLEMADAIVSVDLQDVNVTGAKLWLLSTSEAERLNTETRKCASKTNWWLRTPVSPSVMGVGGNNGGFFKAPYLPDVDMDLGVRPALKLDLSMVEFNSAAKTFSAIGQADPTVRVTDVTLQPTAPQTISVGNTVCFTAGISPNEATDKTVKWNIGGEDPGALALYSDSDCTNLLGTDATDVMTVYAKGVSEGHAVVTCFSNSDSARFASCEVTVNTRHTQIEGLITTITATGDGQASYSIENVATVSVGGAHASYNSVDGWCGNDMIIEVSACDGYTITRCVFYDDANHIAADCEAPFTAETPHQSPAPCVNGVPISGGSRGIKKIDVIGYAPGHVVTITPGSNMTKTADSGDEVQNVTAGEMTAVVYKADDGYYFPSDYDLDIYLLNGMNYSGELNGIYVRGDWNRTTFEIWGEPTADTSITLLPTTAKSKPPHAPATAAAVNCTNVDNNNGKLTGVTTDMEYKKSDADSWTAGTGNDITGLVPGTYYVRFKETETTLASDYQELTIAEYVPGSGTEDDPYRIAGPDNWNELASFVSQGGDTAGKFFLQTENISVTTMIGTAEKPFKGTYDGGGHTLTFTSTDHPERTAPFRYIRDAAIRHLHVDGSITGSRKRAAGLIGENNGVSTVTDCRVSAVISGSNLVGGFCIGTGDTLTITGCIFDGTITGSPNESGCFVAWGRSSLTITDSIAAPQSGSAFTGGAFCYEGGGAPILNNCYFMQSPGTAQGKRAYSVRGGDGVTLNFGTPTADYTVSGVKAYATGLAYGELFYAGQGETVTLTVTPATGYVLSSLTVTQGETEVTVTNNAFTMPAGDVTVSAAFAPDLTTWAGLQAAFNAASTDAEHPTAITLTADVTAASTDAALTIPSGKYVTLDLNGHTIDRGLTGKTAQNDDNVIIVKGNLTLTETSTAQPGKITGGNGYGGVYVNRGTFEMTGGSINGNTANFSGGGVDVDGTFTMSGGSISGNTVSGDNGDGGGVFVSGGTFNLSGAPTISGNVKGGTITNGSLTGGDLNNVYLLSGKTITVTGALTTGASVGVTRKPTGVFTSGLSGKLPSGKTVTDIFTSDSADYSVSATSDGEAQLVRAYAVTIDANITGGTVTANKTSAAAGETVTLTVTPAAGYVLNTLTVTQGETVVTVNADNTFTMPRGNVTVTATFIPVFGPASFTLPASIKTIEESAFEGNTAIGIVYVPDTCTAIGANAFKDCTGLTQIRLPKNCTINGTAFTGCTGLIAVFAPAGGTTETWCASHNITFVAEAQA